jgi:hypothetical protein
MLLPEKAKRNHQEIKLNFISYYNHYTFKIYNSPQRGMESGIQKGVFSM